MVVQKFNNRPPFDLKRLQPAATEPPPPALAPPKQLQLPDGNCAQKSYQNVVRYLEHLDDRCGRPGRRRSSIPKVIESFQRVAPRKQLRPARSVRKMDPGGASDEPSLQTLYRNERSRCLGRNIPDHRLMKDLLQDLEQPDAGRPDLGQREPGRPERGKQSLRAETKILYQSVDEIPSRDTSPPGDQLRTAGEPRRERVNKKTSTSDLVWPAPMTHRARLQEPDRSAHGFHAAHNPLIERQCLVTSGLELKGAKSSKSCAKKSRIPQRKSSAKNDTTIAVKSSKTVAASAPKHPSRKKCSSSTSELEIFPTKESDSSLPKKIMNPLKMISNKQNFPIASNGLNKFHIDKEFPTYKYNTKQNGFKKEQTYVVAEEPAAATIEGRRREKSFVQLQVERLNRRIGGGRARAGRGDEGGRGGNYVDMFSAVRANMPSLAADRDRNSSAESPDWSDHNPEEQRSSVKFPRETRLAMDMVRSSGTLRTQEAAETPDSECTADTTRAQRKIPLSRYTRTAPLQPAIPQARERPPEPPECRRTESSVRQAGLAQSKRAGRQPCARNLLCDKGNHVGPCRRSDKDRAVRCIEYPGYPRLNK